MGQQVRETRVTAGSSDPSVLFGSPQTERKTDLFLCWINGCLSHGSFSLIHLLDFDSTVGTEPRLSPHECWSSAVPALIHLCWILCKMSSYFLSENVMIMQFFCHSSACKLTVLFGCIWDLDYYSRLILLPPKSP